MKTLGNIIWFLLSGVWMALLYALVGLLVCATVVGIPFGLQIFKLAGFILWPFGRVAVKTPEANALSTVGNILWFIPGLFLAVGHLFAAVANLVACIGVITIPICLPFALAHVKFIGLSLFPFGRKVIDAKLVDRAVADALMVPAPRA
jgi:uncharacterized membrane protein YccF (DUF307 family)